MGKKYCSHCGVELPAEARFCGNCGNSVNDAVPTSKTSNIAGVCGICCVLILIFAVLGGEGTPDKNTSDDNKYYNIENTISVNDDYGKIIFDGTYVADIKQYNSTDAIEEQIISKDPGVIFRKITPHGVPEVSSIDDYNDVYEYISNEGLYYSFIGKDNKTYIVTLKDAFWESHNLPEMDEFCLQNAK